MAKTRQAKEKVLSEVAAFLKKAKGLVFADYAGLTVKDMQELRRTLRSKGVSYEVVKKTILRRGLKEVGFDKVNVDNLKGMISVAVSESDEVEPAKQVMAFAKTHEKFQVLGGILETNFVDAAKVKELAKLPGKQELLGQLVGTIAAPISGLVNVLQGNLRGLVQVLSQIGNRK
jgi:large subunit ribosomal protein L10